MGGGATVYVGLEDRNTKFYSTGCEPQGHANCNFSLIAALTFFYFSQLNRLIKIIANTLPK